MNSRPKPTDEQLAKAAAAMKSASSIANFDDRVDHVMKELAEGDEALKKLSAEEGKDVARDTAVEWIVASEPTWGHD